MCMQHATWQSRPSLTPSQIADLRLASSKLTGPERRSFEAAMTLKYCEGNPLMAEAVFGWGRQTVALGLAESRSGIICLGAQAAFSGRKRWEEQQPQAAQALRQLADAHAQQDPTTTGGPASRPTSASVHRSAASGRFGAGRCSSSRPPSRTAASTSPRSTAASMPWMPAPGRRSGATERDAAAGPRRRSGDASSTSRSSDDGRPAATRCPAATASSWPTTRTAARPSGSGRRGQTNPHPSSTEDSSTSGTGTAGSGRSTADGPHTLDVPDARPHQGVTCAVGKQGVRRGLRRRSTHSTRERAGSGGAPPPSRVPPDAARSTPHRRPPTGASSSATQTARCTHSALPAGGCSGHRALADTSTRKPPSGAG